MRSPFLRAAIAFCALLVSFTAGASAFPKLDEFGKSLNLNPAQQAQFDVAAAATQRAVFAAAFEGMKVKALVQEEFAKPRPDLETLAQAREASAARLKPLHDAARAEWLKLYALLADDQVAIVKGFLEERLGHLEALQKFVMSLMLGKVAAP